MDSSLASSATSAGAGPLHGGAGGARAPPRRGGGGADVTLPSFAATFRSADYDQPPPGITQHDWARLARGRGAGDGDDSESLLDERLLDTDAHGGRGSAAGQYAALQRTGQGAYRPASASSSRATFPSSSSRFPSASTAHTSHPDASSTADTTTADDSTSRDTSDAADRTETTHDHLASARLAVDSIDVSSAQATDDDPSLVYGAGVLGGNRPGQRAEKKGGQAQNMTLREQEKVIDELKKDNFSLKLKLHFYEQRLEKMAPSAVEQALRENIQLKVEFQTLRTELKRYKKLLLEGDKAIQHLTRERDELQRTRGRVSSDGGAAGARERELEQRLREQEDARNQWERKARELHDKYKQLKAGGGSGEAEELRHQLDEALDESDQLRRQVTDAHDELDELRGELEHMRHELADQADQSGVSLEGRSRGTIRREVERLEQLTMLSTRNDEKDSLRVQVEDLKADLQAVENELELATRAARRARGSQGGEGDREELERELDTHRDRAASLSLELEDVKTQLDAKEREIEDLLREIDERDEVHRQDVERVAEEWRDEVEDAREREAQARQILEEKDADLDELTDKVEVLVRQLAEKDAQMQADEEEVEALTHDLEKLGGQIFQLEEEADEKDKHIDELQHELDALGREFEDKQALHEQVVGTLKEKLSTAKSRLSELTIQHESVTTESTFLRSKVEDLALAHAKLEEQLRSNEGEKRQLQADADEILRALRKEEDEREAIEGELGAARHEAQRARDLVDERERDVGDLQRALNGLERSTRQQGETGVALELELERAKRDLARAEEDAERARRDLNDRVSEAREKDLRIATLESDKKDLAAQLASQTQTRLSLADKHEHATKTLRDTQIELTSARERLRVVEDQLNTDHRVLSRTENQYRDQLTERNTLLLTVYQAVDRIAGSDKRKAASPTDSPKPFSNFPSFHDRLLERLKSVNQLQMSFERRARELESKFVDQVQSLKRQQDNRHKQLDRFEASLKTATETQRQWRQRVQQKSLELEQARAEVSSLQSQLTSLRRSPNPNSPNPSSSSSPSSTSEATLRSRLSAAQASTATLERRLGATQAQLGDAEARLGEQRGKYGVAEGKWEARVRELEQRCRAAEERVKRERQGAKERMEELRGESRRLEGELADAQRRGTQLDDVLRQRQQQQQQDRPGSAQASA
ncbi:hypothetical protein Rhopal_007343-T1 [Rhodotorula paludigena]|uniref:Centrosomin N-terminal motif 1 domain-containing protein n=1 Tax=Rhodotorula paludigena TaxID=86838 RepID=A0AAV5GUQ1_9BASI|nr:hypothetical protein Rhopal_007343-T1 [Rhodotorula paludigena]